MAWDLLSVLPGCVRISTRCAICACLVPHTATRLIFVSKFLGRTQDDALSLRQLADPAAAWRRPD